ADRNRSHWSTSKTPSYTKSVSWQHHQTVSTYKVRLMDKLGCSTLLELYDFAQRNKIG
ncbi:hypothetical protein M0O23_14990, partial [Klebsiella pneumoniae]|nr:hypothetical protein [Klebsiella pneumoniae]MCL0372628.1 hypothetical protein [Klebsiella pneumoniae subsp. pneumoniae]MCD9715047.1 hypothetical protein [Klebsiella pneumoniae]MCJ4578512.1 hypothetical protein [Klebsiella pneumoniae]MCJ4951279.1 hypothetical protein [Klebsiella pneumoniae]